MTAPDRHSLGGKGGQASVELLASVPAMIFALMIAIQLAITGYTLHLADGAAEAGALAIAAGTDPEAAALAAMPGWAEGRVDVDVAAGQVDVAVRPPAPVAAVSRALEVSASAWSRGPGGG